MFCPLDIKVKASQVCVVISGGWIAAQAVAVMLCIYDVAKILRPISVDPSAMFITEVRHCNTAFQDITSHHVNDLLKFSLERWIVQVLRSAWMPCVPEFVAATSEVYADMTDSPQPLVL